MSSPKSKPKHLREPPPSLFLGPPSQNASHVSLSATLGPPIGPTTTSSSLKPARAPLSRMSSRFDGTSSVPEPSIPRPAVRPFQDIESKKQADRIDALWAEMQSTLEEVELSAVNETHVFGPEHARALSDLRAAQIGLAKAWARSEADDAGENESKSFNKGLSDTMGSTVSGTGRPGSSSGIGSSMGLEEETAGDILLARKRREANDKYFQRVNGGVLDVVKKLEEVASAMRAVEQESRDIWGENESAATSIHG